MFEDIKNSSTRAMTSNGKNKVTDTKICILGSPGVGKSGNLFLS